MVSHLTLLLTYCTLFKGFSSTFRYLQEPHPFSSIFKGLQIIFVNLGILKDFSRTLIPAEWSHHPTRLNWPVQWPQHLMHWTGQLS